MTRPGKEGMRKELSQKFTESGGSHTSHKFPRSRKVVGDPPEEDSPSQQSMRGSHRNIDPFYSPYGPSADRGLIRRYLVANRGRPWDDVYKEFCDLFDVRSFSGQIVLEALEQIVDRQVEVGEDGEIRSLKCQWFRDKMHRFFVHPETGVLEYRQGSRKKRPEPEQKVFELEGKLYHKHDGLWYRVEMMEIHLNHRGMWPVSLDYITDAFGAHEKKVVNGWGRHLTDQFRDRYGEKPGGGVWYCVSKQSANSKEIAKLKKIVGKQ